MTHDPADPACSCDACFRLCREARCVHPEHQRRPWVEVEGESPEHRALRRMVHDTALTPVEWAMMGVV